MQHALVFDTLAYANKLKAAGVPEKQAEIQAEALAGVMSNDLVTHSDLDELEVSSQRDMKELETALRRDMKELETTLKRDIKELEISLKRDIKELELHMVTKLGGIVVAGISMLTIIMKLFHL